jgi:hypothetical protein
MKPRRLVDDKRYQGKYVAFRSFEDNTVLAYGRDPKKVRDYARNAGATDPVLVFVPKDKAYVY